MKKACILVLAIVAFAPCVLGQDGMPMIKATVMSAFVWGEDSTSGSRPTDRQCDTRMSYAGIEVSSRIGFERVGTDFVGTLLNYTTTIVNNTDATLTVRYGGISVDGHVASPLWVVPAGTKLSKKELKSKPGAVELGKIHCLTSGFISSDNFFSESTSSQVLSVAARAALMVSSIVRDPRRYHSVLCSVGGCYPTGTIRYYLTVDTKDYVFVWPGRSAIYCGA